MSTPTWKRYLIAGPATLRDQANMAASTWDTVGGQLSFVAPMLYVLGADPAIATHTAIHTRIEDVVAQVIQQTIEPHFPGWTMIQHDDPEAALALAGLGRVRGKLVR